MPRDVRNSVARIAILAVAPALLAVAIGVFSVFRLDMIRKSVSTVVDDLSVSRTLADEMVHHTILARFYAHRFATTRAQADRDAFERGYTDLRALLAHAEVLFVNPERRKLLREIQEALDRYRVAFDEMTLLIHSVERTRSGVLDVQENVFRATLAALRVHTMSLDNPRAFLAFTNAQGRFDRLVLNTARYLTTGDERYAAPMDADYQEAQLALSVLGDTLADPVQRENVTVASNALEAYYQGFLTVRSDSLALKALFQTQRDVLEPEIVGVASQISEGIQQELALQNKVVRDLVAQTQYTLLGITVIGAVTSLALAVVATRRVAERARAEAELRRHRDRLEEEVAKRTEELALANEQLRLEMIEREHLIAELKEALSKVKTLSGLIPICASCKKVRDDQGYWHQVEAYVREHSDAEFSHGICPECARRLYPELFSDEE